MQGFFSISSYKVSGSQTQAVPLSSSGVGRGKSLEIPSSPFAVGPGLGQSTLILETFSMLKKFLNYKYYTCL